MEDHPSWILLQSSSPHKRGICQQPGKQPGSTGPWQELDHQRELVLASRWHLHPTRGLHNPKRDCFHTAGGTQELWGNQSPAADSGIVSGANLPSAHSCFPFHLLSTDKSDSACQGNPTLDCSLRVPDGGDLRAGGRVGLTCRLV